MVDPNDDRGFRYGIGVGLQWNWNRIEIGWFGRTRNVFGELAHCECKIIYFPRNYYRMKVFAFGILDNLPSVLVSKIIRRVVLPLGDSLGP